MAKTIFDLVTAPHIASYWTEMGNAETNVTAGLFPPSKQLGLKLSWIKGSKGLPVVLKPSAYDVHAIPRARIGFSELITEMPHFKESLYVDEELRQQLNMVLQTGNQGFIDSVMIRVFDDQLRLLRGAAARREQMRCMALTTGVIAFMDNGQAFEYDYGISHKVAVTTSWADLANADPLEDIRNARETIQGETGEVLTRAMCDGFSWKNLRQNERIRRTISEHTRSNEVIISDTTLKRFILDEAGIEIVVNDRRYAEPDGTTVPYVPASTFVLFPSGQLGNTWFGTTPAESDLTGSKVANVSIVDTGVAITTAERVDPVQVETIVSQICLPSLERADSIYILDTGN